MASKMKFCADGSYNGKTEIIRSLAKKLGMPRTVVERIIDAFLILMKDDIMEQRVIHLPGFVTVYYKQESKIIKSPLSNVDYGRITILSPKVRLQSDVLRRYKKRHGVYTKAVADEGE